MRIGNRLVAYLSAALLAGAGAVALPTTAQAANLLDDPGFESGSLADWDCGDGAGSVVSSPVHSGTKALAGAATAAGNARCAQTVAVQPGTTYTLSAWVRGGYVYLGVTGGNATWTASASGPAPR